MAQPQPSVLPDRIDPDAIVEALVEFRFDHTDLPEAIVGRLLDTPLWADYTRHRLPAADFPQPLKDMDPNLRYQPIIELRRSDLARVVKFGGHVFSYHVVGTYPGWTEFSKEIDQITNIVTGKLLSPSFSRLGFRYINVFVPEKHHVTGLSETNISIAIGEESLVNSLNLNYLRRFETNHVVTVRVATPDLISSTSPNIGEFSLFCDIDVATKDNTPVDGADEAKAWIGVAHDIEKAEFFKILKSDVAEKLTRKSEGETHA
jgi:uncharacterized protein (TIGR04255 family)